MGTSIAACDDGTRCRQESLGSGLGRSESLDISRVLSRIGGLVGGRMLAARVSEKTVSFGGGILFFGKLKARSST
jgi:hypothetical protein